MTPADWWALDGPPPLHATRRAPELVTEGGEVAACSDLMLGAPFLPWQGYVADVAGELNPDGSYRWPVVVVTVPRQSGKTTLLRAVGTHRCLTRPDAGVFYTAQTGKDARDRWADLVKAIKRGPLSELVTVRTAQGSERVGFANDSAFRVFAPVATSLHGYTPAMVMLDEAFAHDETTGDDLLGAIGPAMITVRHRQLWIVSTAGTAASTFLRRWVEAGRRGDDGVAFFEWAAGDDIVDLYDPTCWPSFHPGMVGDPPLVSVEAVADEARRLPRSEFERAYGNRWTRTSSTLIAGERWRDLADEAQRSPRYLTPREVVFAPDVMHDRSAAAIVAAWRTSTGQLQLRVVKSAPGDGWVAAALQGLRAQGWRRFAYAADGPVRDIVTGLDWSAEPVGGRDYADAWGQLLRAIASGQLRHDGSDVLAVAVANVATRPMLDTAAPSRRASAGDITPLVGGMVASWVLDHKHPGTGSISYRVAG